jgi:hypothetical protein
VADAFDRTSRGKQPVRIEPSDVVGGPSPPAVNPGRAGGTIVVAGHPGLVDTVLVASRVVKRGGRLLDVDLPTLRGRLLESRGRIAAAASVSLDGTWHPSTDSD